MPDLKRGAVAFILACGDYGFPLDTCKKAVDSWLNGYQDVVSGVPCAAFPEPLVPRWYFELNILQIGILACIFKFPQAAGFPAVKLHQMKPTQKKDGAVTIRFLDRFQRKGIQLYALQLRIVGTFNVRYDSILPLLNKKPQNKPLPKTLSAYMV